MQKVQVMLDDRINDLIRSQASETGLSVSSFTRMIINDYFKKSKQSIVEKAMQERDEDIESITLDEFKSQLKELY